jgi:hypothetical protein
LKAERDSAKDSKDGNARLSGSENQESKQHPFSDQRSDKSVDSIRHGHEDNGTSMRAQTQLLIMAAARASSARPSSTKAALYQEKWWIIILTCQDDLWGPASRGGATRAHNNCCWHAVIIAPLSNSCMPPRSKSSICILAFILSVASVAMAATVTNLKLWGWSERKRTLCNSFLVLYNVYDKVVPSPASDSISCTSSSVNWPNDVCSTTRAKIMWHRRPKPCVAMDVATGYQRLHEGTLLPNFSNKAFAKSAVIRSAATSGERLPQQERRQHQC